MLDELKNAIETQGQAFADFKARIDADLDKHAKAIGDVQKTIARPGYVGTAADPSTRPTEFWRDCKTGAPVPVLRHGESLAALDSTGTSVPTVGRFLRGITLGGRADDARELEEERKSLGVSVDPAGGYLVPGPLAARWVDLLRAQSVLSQAGVSVIPMDSATLQIARVTEDASATWHGEGAAISDSDPTFGAANLTAKTVVIVTKLSLELAQDAPNIENVLQSTLTAALAAAIDKAGLVGSATDSAAAPLGIFNAPDRNKVTSVGAPSDWTFLQDGIYELLADNVRLQDVGAFIAHPKVWRKMIGVKTGISGDKTSLPMPAEIARLPMLYTTSAPFASGTTCAGIVGDWRDYVWGIRRAISVRILDQAYLASNLQLAIVCHARCDFVPLRQTSFCTMEGITV